MVDEAERDRKEVCDTGRGAKALFTVERIPLI